jgi:hypothetical protein
VQQPKQATAARAAVRHVSTVITITIITTTTTLLAAAAAAAFPLLLLLLQQPIGIGRRLLGSQVVASSSSRMRHSIGTSSITSCS